MARKKAKKKTTTKRKKKRTSKKKRVQSNRYLKKFIFSLFLISLVALAFLFGWAEYRVQNYLRAGENTDKFSIVGITGEVSEERRVPINLLSSGRSSRRKPIALPIVPDHLINALLTIEDRRFYSHFGIDIRALFRATLSNITKGRVVQGGSTLTQQLSKNLFLSSERTLVRKILEFAIAIVLELHLSKENILELYLNEVYLGQLGNTALHGVGSAAESFFQKDVKEITIDESALLAGIIRAPSTYSPRHHPKRAKARRDLVIDQLKLQKFITSSQAKTLKKKPLKIAKPKNSQRFAPYFGVALKKSIDHYFHLQTLKKKGATIVTGLSEDLQRCGEEAVQVGLTSLEKQYPFLKRKKGAPIEAGLVSLNPKTGVIHAWVGGRDYRKNQFDHVSLAKRQIGSTIKPFIYLTALDPNLNSYKTGNLRTLLPDKPVSVPLPNGETWEPSNADRRYRGEVTFRYALEQSLNLPPVHIVRRIGVPTVQQTLKAFKVHPSPPPVLALALGAVETDLLSLTSAYGALANGGVLVPPRFFTKIEGVHREVLYDNSTSGKRVADRGATFLVNDVLRGVIRRGTAQRAQLKTKNSFPAGKTGTSQDGRDAWFVGFTDSLVTGVWVGYDDNTPIRVSGGRAAAPIWKHFMECSTPYLEFSRPTIPDNIETVKIDTTTNKRAHRNCPPSQTITEFFLRGTVTDDICDAHGGSPRGVIPSEKENKRWSEDDKRKKESFWERIFGN